MAVFFIAVISDLNNIQAKAAKPLIIYNSRFIVMRLNLYTASYALVAYGIAANRLEAKAEENDKSAATELAQSY